MMRNRLMLLPAITVLSSFIACYVTFNEQFMGGQNCPSDGDLTGSWVTKKNPRGSKIIIISKVADGLLIQDVDPASDSKLTETFAHAQSCSISGVKLLMVRLYSGMAFSNYYAPVAYTTAPDEFTMYFFDKKAWSDLCATGELQCPTNDGGSVVVASPAAETLKAIERKGIKSLIDWKENMVMMRVNYSGIKDDHH